MDIKITIPTEKNKSSLTTSLEKRLARIENKLVKPVPRQQIIYKQMSRPTTAPKIVVRRVKVLQRVNSNLHNSLKKSLAKVRELQKRKPVTRTIIKRQPQRQPKIQERIVRQKVPAGLAKALATNTAALNMVNRRLGMQLIPSPS